MHVGHKAAYSARVPDPAAAAGRRMDARRRSISIQPRATPPGSFHLAFRF